MGPGDLQEALSGLVFEAHPDILVGWETADDAGVVRLDDHTGLIHTVDFFSPVVDDPFDFGRIAAANALSDVYAMGGKPLAALNLAAYPAKEDLAVLGRILAGGLEKIREAGALLVGGHTVDDQEIKYGLAVTGIVHPDRILRNAGARAGDAIILTKPIGTGLVATAIKAGKAPGRLVEIAVASMARLNRDACAAALASGAHGATDITGFGLLGHAAEMAAASGVALRIRSDAIPLIDGAFDLARMGIVPGGTSRNRAFFAPRVQGLDDLPGPMQHLLFDPQTSGGLFLSVPGERAEACLAALRQGGDGDSAVIGEVLEAPAGRILIR